MITKSRKDKQLLDYGFYNMNCMEGMGQFPDNYFDLALVDPPYGIRRAETFSGKRWKKYDEKQWDSERPNKKYFDELFRVSKNQIIWGGNYFTEYIPPSMGWIFWDKGQDLTMSDGELAFTSFDRALRRKIIYRCKIGENGGLIHPTQKPVLLYRWILKRYGQAGWNILDTHVGSGSSLIACEREEFKYVGFEIDTDYYKAAMERIKRERQQLTLAL